MSEPTRLAKQTAVSEAVALLDIEPLLVHGSDDLTSIMRRSTAQPETRLVGVVDADGRLIGIIPILRLAELVVARVVPEALLTDIVDVADVARFGHAVEARTAAEAMLEPASVLGTDTLDEAFKTMHRRHLSGLYVVDADGRVSGYLDLLELALRYAEAIAVDDAIGDA